VRYRQASWAESLQRVERGEADAVVSAYKSDARDFLFTDAPFGRSTNCFFTRPDSSWTFHNQDSLSQVRLGVIRAYSYGSQVDQYVKANGTTDRVLVADGKDALGQLLRALDASRIGALVEDELVVAWRLKQEHRPPDSLRNASCAVSAGLYVAFSPAPARLERSRRLIRIWNEQFDRLLHAGELTSIYDRYR
jgi:polar amino acid transport system substrate-binding protein